MKHAARLRSTVIGMLFLAHAAAAQFTQQGSKLAGADAVGAAQQAWSVAISADGNTTIVGGPADSSNTGAAWLFTQSGGVWSQQGSKLVGTGAVGPAFQGSAVAISADGNTVIVSGPADNSNAGAAWVYTRSGGVWSQQGSKLVGTGAAGAAQQGTSVAISADGNTAIVGGWADNSSAGASWVFTRSGAVWSQQGSKLVGTGAVGGANQGWSVAISADGNTAIVGGALDKSGVGASWVFTRSGGVWSQQGSKLVGTGAVGAAYQGNTVAISADGSTAVSSGPGDSSFAGAAWVFTQSGGVWSQQSSKLVGTGAAGAAGQGIGLAISADGNTAILGGSGDNSNAGATWVFTRSGGVWSQQGGKLVGTGAVGAAQQGASVAISADGNTAILGGYADNPYAGAYCGATWVFTRSTGAWSQLGSKLVGTGAVGTAQQGSSVAISADGNTAIVGGTRDDSSAGAAWVYTRSGGVWSQQGSKLVGTGAVGAAQQGASVAISADGNTAVVGGPQDNSAMGAVWVYTRSGGVWTQQGSKLVGTGAGTTIYQGTSVAISADGNTVVVGGPFDNSGDGAACVFTRSGGVWSQQGGKLVGTGSVGAARQGSSVAISADGNTAIIGGPLDNTSAGAVWVFTRSGGVWTQQGSKLVGTGAVYVLLVDQGYSVAISADGNTAIVGGWGDNSSVGAAWVFTRSGGVWSQQGSKLVGTGAAGKADQGQSVAISADGNTAIVGGLYDNSSVGAAWVFTRCGGVWSQQGSKLVGTGAVGTAQQGWSAALSADGTTAIVGGKTDDSNAGAAWVFISSASQLAFVQQPTTTAAGKPITPAVTVQLQDGGGSPVAECGATITVSLSSGTGTLGGTLSQPTNASGLATFNDLSVNLVGTKSLSASSTGLTGATSSSFLVIACASITGTVTGGGLMCEGDSSSVLVIVAGGTPPYTVTLNNGGGTQTGTGPAFTFTVSPSATTTYSVAALTDGLACVGTGSGTARVTVHQPPTTATVGSPQTICENGTTTGLGGNAPTVGTGLWSVVSGGTGIFSPSATSPNATFTHTGGTGPIVLRWTISSGCGTSFAEVAESVSSAPKATISGDATICAGRSASLTVTLTSGTAPFHVVVNGATYDLAASPGTITVSPASTTTYTISSVTAGTCANPSGGSGSASVTVNQPPTAATVGGPQTICANGTTTGLGGNAPTVGTGLWSVVSGGAGTFSPSATTPNATFSHTGGTGPIVLRWTISSGCGTSSADMTVSVSSTPKATLSGDATICAGRSASLTVTLTSGTAPFHLVVNGTTYDFTASPGTIMVNPIVTTTYSISSVTAGGCTNASGGSGTATVTVTSQLCIDDVVGDSRFRAEVTWTTTQGGGDGAPHAGHPIPTASLGLGRGGLFWFFAPDNPEVLVKVLNGCAVNGRYWVLAAFGTNAGFTMKLTDSVSGAVAAYSNPDGTVATPVLDTVGFQCGAAASQARSLEPASEATALAAVSGCTPDGAVLCVDDVPGDARFRVKVDWATKQGGGDGLPHPGQALSTASLGVRRGGLFWFFARDNPEILAKVLNGCAVNRSYWVFAAGATNVGLTMSVTDTVTGLERRYTNPDLMPVAPVQDVTAFTCN